MLKDLHNELTTARYAAKAVNIPGCCCSLSAPTRRTRLTVNQWQTTNICGRRFPLLGMF